MTTSSATDSWNGFTPEVKELTIIWSRLEKDQHWSKHVAIILFILNITGPYYDSS
jgi:hypothetical protein